MWFSRPCCVPRRLYAQLDYARHMPRSYINKTKRTIPRVVYDNRYGAPPVTRYYVHPDDDVPDPAYRSWEKKTLQETLEKQSAYHSAFLNNKYYHTAHRKIRPIPDEEWTIFPGDTVQVMIGKDRIAQGVVARVLKESNSVFVDGLHTKFEEESQGLEEHGVPSMFKWAEQPLDPSKDEVMLVDPNDKEPCTASWVLNEAKTDWIRVSDRTGFEIPLPIQAKVTYDYVTPADYIEVPDKDTPSLAALKRTYTPKLSLVEDELAESLGIKDDRQYRPSYFY